MSKEKHWSFQYNTLEEANKKAKTLTLDGGNLPLLVRDSPSQENRKSLNLTPRIDRYFKYLKTVGEVPPLSDFSPFHMECFLETFTLPKDKHKNARPKNLRILFLEKVRHVFITLKVTPLFALYSFEFGENNGQFHMHALSVYRNTSQARYLKYYFSREIGNFDQTKVRNEIADLPRSFDYVIKDVNEMIDLKLYPVMIDNRAHAKGHAKERSDELS